MIQITRLLAKQVRTVFRKLLGPTVRGAFHLHVLAGPDGLRIQGESPEHAAEYHLAGELTPAELLGAADESRAAGKSPAPFLTAFHVRLAQALTPLAFALFGVPLAMSSRAARTRGYLLALGVYVAYYLVERTFENLGTAGRLAPWLAGMAPNLVFGAFGTWLFVRLTRRGLVA